MTTRTRFAPSPTGYIHVGNARSALFPYLLAKQQKGQFILRIEDTDQARFVEDATDLILDTLTWLGLTWDEGPRVGGSYGPYFQTERKSSYQAWAQKLIDKGLAYADPYTPEEVEAFREQAKQEKRAFLYRDHRPENPPVWDGSMPLRFKVPEIKRYEWHDEVMGDLSAGPEALDDFILIKSDGLPTYNFAHIVDDADMQVTHVIRGLEYIPSMPKYLSLYDALELPWPIFAHLPHILAADGKKKLGKRDGAKSVTEYRDEGILPEAMLNFLASMGWNDGTEQEVFTLQELVEKFSLDRVQRSGARFDEQRLLWLNGQHIRLLSLDDLYQRVTPFWPESARNADEAAKKQVLALVQDRLKTLADLPVLTSYFFEEPAPDWQMITSNKQLAKLENQEVAQLLEAAKAALEASAFDPESLQETLNGLLETTGQKPGILFSLIRLAVSWAPFSPALNDTLAVLGKDTVVRRLSAAIASR
ncbi:glutamate--tRNA ligase [Candidatus Saccharibacteria bacterium 47-87]|nr:glutamate--tRNA ligase [Candidatus Saccharibacteria bacterium]OJU96878.1 MAG: glutamate--tRNA ligase [Candidatus Saccharibacteria bacterium 47-87]